MRTFRVFKFIGMGILGIAAISLFVFITMHLWNCLIPLLFHGPILSYWQTAGLLLLSKIFFSGFHGRHHGRHHGRCHGRGEMKDCCNGERPNREEWWKRFHEMKKGRECCSKTEESNSNS
jgi:hypothetical protein